MQDALFRGHFFSVLCVINRVKNANSFIMEENYPHMCELCFPDGIEFGFIGNGSLVLFNGNYMLLCGQGHRDDDIYTFPIKPEPNPLGKLDLCDEEWEALSKEKQEEEFKWFESVTDHTREAKFHIGDAFEFVAACIKTGDVIIDKGSIWSQVWHHCGMLIKNYEEKNR